MTGRNLMASGRVPRTTRTRPGSPKGELPVQTPSSARGLRPDGARVLSEGDDVEGRLQPLQDLVNELDFRLRRQIHPREEGQLPDAIAAEEVQRMQKVRGR